MTRQVHITSFLLFFSASLFCGMATAEEYVPSPTFEFKTPSGHFVIDRQFAPISVWKHVRFDEPMERNSFVVKLPADYITKVIPVYQPNLNDFTQDVFLTIEALNKRRLEQLAGSMQPNCKVETHDLVPTSIMYKRCVYRIIIEDKIAVKFRLNGENTKQRNRVVKLIDGLLDYWCSCLKNGVAQKK